MGKWRYGVILDAGSSGTRVHIYRWLDSAKARHEASASELHSLPKLETKKKWTKKIHPGVSTFGDDPSAVGEHHLQELLDHALKYVPEHQVEDTPIFLMATAGMRLLPPLQQKALLAEICSYAREHTDFSLPDCDLHIQVIPGETEGLYGWIAANYLLGGFDSPDDHAHGKGHHTYGFLDMGGASAQIAFAPNATEAERHANDLKLLRMRTLDGNSTEYKVFVATWLGFGVNQARKRYIEALIEATGGVRDQLPDPCLPAGLEVTALGEPITAEDKASPAHPFLFGTGNFNECLRQTYPLLDKDAPCLDQPCLLNGQHVPAIDFDVNHFVGVSEYWHTTHGIFEQSYNSKSYDFNTYQKRVSEFCSQDWDAIEAGVEAHKWGEKVDIQTVEEVCFKASWLINVLHEGIGIPRVGLEKTPSDSGYNGTKAVLQHAKEKGFLDPFQAVDKIDDVEVSWTLGKMVLYAAGQVEPSALSAQSSDLPVGFGSNIDGGTIPPDFQYAGSSYEVFENEHDDDDHHDNDDDDWEDKLFDTAKSHKSNGSYALIFLLAMFLIYFFRKRERRIRLYNKVINTFRRSKRPGSPRGLRKPSTVGAPGFWGAGKFFGRGRGSGSYERVLEDGDAVNEFELGEVSSEEEGSEGSERVGRPASLVGTPRLGGGAFFESNAGVGAGLMSPRLSGMAQGPVGKAMAMDRTGLVVRTESRERMSGGFGGPVLLGAGRRSRAGSPTRGLPKGGGGGGGGGSMGVLEED